LSQVAGSFDWKKGDSVRVVRGPYHEFSGKIEEVDIEREKLKVSINIFGRETVVELEPQQVRKL
jgi:transcriptional antiterminator NusG